MEQVDSPLGKLVSIELGVMGYVTTSYSLNEEVEKFLLTSPHRNHGGSSDFFSEEFPRLARGSLFTSFYGFIELTLMRMCTDVFEPYQSEKLEAMRGKGAYKAVTYLQDVVTLSLPDYFDKEGKLGLLNIVRNSFAHNLGVVPKKDVQIFRRLQSKYSLSTDIVLDENDSSLHPNDRFVCNVENEFAEVFDGVLRTAKEHVMVVEPERYGSS